MVQDFVTCELMEETATMDSEPDTHELTKEASTQTRLYWNYLHLHTLPERLIEEGSHIEQIHLKCNLLRILPDNFGHLTNLTCCYLNSNNLEALPDSIGDLKSLKILDVGNNNLACLPVTLGKLPALRSLVAVHNKLKCYPTELCSMKSLSVLMLSRNYLTSLPSAVKGLIGLQGLHVDHNLLKELPRSLTLLPMLTRLSCCGNNITYLPALPFTSHPMIYYDNCEVKYLPFTYVCQAHCGPTWDTVILPTCGYFPKVVIENNTVCISLSQSGRQEHLHSLVLPPQLQQVTRFTSGSSTVPPLKELCLSFLFKAKWCASCKSVVCEAGLHNGDTMMDVIPKSLFYLLEEGPVSWCNNQECHSPIFTFTSIIVVSIAVSPQPNTDVSWTPMLLYFCSDACAYNLTKSLDEKTDEFSCWLSDKLKKPYYIEVT